MAKKVSTFVFALGLALLALPAVAQPLFLFPAGTFYKPLEFSNGNKIMVGRFNTLHAVYESGAIIKYTTSADGFTWSTPANVSAGYGAADHGSIAIDSSGNIGIVWVASPGANGVGALYYASKTHAATAWNVVSLGVNGAEPAITGRGTTMYLAWTIVQMVQYASFPSLTPGTLVVEILESSSCPNTGFRKPSITLIQNPCYPPIPRVGYLYFSDEQATGGACQALNTLVGPHVCQRNNVSSTWAMIYDGTQSSLAAGSVEPISLSLSANFSTGNTFLAWSDEQNGTARTLLAHGNPNTWTASTFDADRHHVHVRANGASNAPATQFRLAWTGGGFSDEFFNWDTHYDTATWPGAAPAWAGSVHLSAYGGYTGRPQGVFWKRCASGLYFTTQAYFEAEPACSSAFVATDFETTSPCPPVTPGPIVAYPCKYLAVAIARMPLGYTVGTAIDTTDLGVITRLDRSSAYVTTDRGQTVTITWSSGEVVASADTSLTLSAPREEVTITSRETNFKTEDYGYLEAYDPRYFEEGGQCRDEKK